MSRHLLSALAVAALALGSLGGAGASEFKIGSTMFFSTDEPPQLPVCLTNYQVRRAVEAAGYGQVKLNVPNGDHIQVKASQGAGTYLIDFNRCTGMIEAVQALR